MDPRAHRRFLDYVEKHQYFARPGFERLSRERWMGHDAERAALADKQAAGTITAEELARLAWLRRLLLVD